MTQKDKELLLKDLCVRLPYEVKGLHRGEIQRLLIIDSFGSYQVNEYDAWFSLSSVEFKPYLRPMSSMTEEEKQTFISLSNNMIDDWMVKPETCCYFMDKLTDWLNEHHFDYRGLIEKGLALAAPEGMYKN